MRKLRVLVVDDNPQFREAARNLLSCLPEVACIELANTGAEALVCVTQFKPDVVLMDIMMPGINGLEAIGILRSRMPAPRIYAVTLHDTAEYRSAALKNGAEGLISKRDFAAVIPELLVALAGAAST